MERRVYGRYMPRKIPPLPIQVKEEHLERPIKRKCDVNFNEIESWETIQRRANPQTIFRQTSRRVNIGSGNFNIRFCKKDNSGLLNDVTFNMIVNIYNAKEEVLGFTNFMIQSSEGQLHLKSARNYFSGQFTGTPMCVVEPLDAERSILNMVSDFDFIIITRPRSPERFFEIVTADGFTYSWGIDKCESAETWCTMMRQAMYMDLDTRFGSHLGKDEDEDRYTIQYAVL